MSRKLAQEYLKKGDKINTKVIFDNGRIFKIEIEGEIKDMPKMTINDLAKIVTDGFDKINSRLDKVEQDIKEIKSRVSILESFHKNDFDKLKSQNKK